METRPMFELFYNREPERPDLEGILWCATARLRGAVPSPALEYLSFDGEEWAACDGHRLHVYRPTLKYPVGLWEVIVGKARRIALAFQSNPEAPLSGYPPWRELPHWSENSHLDPIPVKGGIYIESDYASVLRRMSDDQTLNFHFFKEIVGPGPGEIRIPDGPGVIFRNGNRRGLVMGMRKST